MKFTKKLFLRYFEYIFPPFQKVYVRTQEHDPMFEGYWINCSGCMDYEVIDIFSAADTDSIFITVKVL